MPKKDLLLSIAASYVAAISLLPTLINTRYLDRLPYPYVVLFVIFPIVCVAGMQIAHRIGKKYSFLWQIAKFGFVGVLNTAIDFGVFNALIALTSITASAAIIGINVLSFSVAVINSYFWNKQWVFTAGKKGNFITFFVVTLIGLFINTGTVYVLTNYLGPDSTSPQTQWANLAKVIATCFSLIWNFVGYKLIVFKKK